MRNENVWNLLKIDFIIPLKTLILACVVRANFLLSLIRNAEIAKINDSESMHFKCFEIKLTHSLFVKCDKIQTNLNCSRLRPAPNGPNFSPLSFCRRLKRSIMSFWHSTGKISHATPYKMFVNPFSYVSNGQNINQNIPYIHFCVCVCMEYFVNF